MNNNYLGISAIVFGTICFSVNDISVKLFSSEIPLNQLMFFRAIFAISILLFVILPFYGGFKYLNTSNPVFHIFRGLAVVGANTFFFISIAELSLAEATAIFFIAPILITIFAMFFLQEKVGIRRGLACFIGFLGMLFIIKPGTISFELISIFPLIAALFYTALHIITRKYGSQEKPLTMGFYIQVCFLVTSLMFAGGFYLADFDAEHSNALTFLTGSWVSVSTFDMFHILVGIALPISIGGILVSYAYKNYEASFLAPFEYGALVIAVVSTYLIWNEIPDRLSLIGMILIMLSGIFVSLREKQVSSIRSSRKIIHRR
ncbi:MAG: DMT family transporter [Paracoccaceae bacterium]|tara:strand:- start:286 stop:1239 length:954 start_codon:yes stop_codon:yes gene_type:complete